MIRAHVEGKGEMMSKADIYEDIRAVKARYCRFLVTKNWKDCADLFTEDDVPAVREDHGLDPFLGRDTMIEKIRTAETRAKLTLHSHPPKTKSISDYSKDRVEEYV